MSDPLGMAQKKNANPCGRDKLLKWEKIGKTGKVKYIPAQEAIMLSSGAKNLGSPSKINMNSKSGPSKISIPISERTPIKPKVMSPESSLYVKANPRFGFSEFPPTRNGNSLTNQVGQQVTQASKEPKGNISIEISCIYFVLSLILMGIKKGHLDFAWCSAIY